MQVKINSIHLENFKGCTEATYVFNEKNASVFGANATGKTTILDAFWWLLFNKDSMGNEKFSIRPLDADGNQVDNVEIKVSIVLEVDGRETELTKVQKQNWVKHRGSAMAKLEGNVNTYEIDGYPKSAKEFGKFISELVSEDVFKMITNPAYFPSLKWKDQREIVMRFVNDVSDYDLASKEPAFKELLPELQKAPSTDDIQKKFSKALSEWKKKQTELPVRIDEISKQKVDIDVAELELQKKEIEKQITENKAKQADVSKQFEEYQKLSDGVLELQFKLSDLQTEANRGLEIQKRDLQKQISRIETQISRIENDISKTVYQINGYELDVESGTKERSRLADLWKKVKAEVFDENQTICPTCGQKLPEEKISQLVFEFDSKKKDRLVRIEKDGLEAKQDIDNAKAMILKLQEHEQASQEELSKLKSEVRILKADLIEIVQEPIDVSNTEEYKALKSQIAEKEEQMQKANTSYGEGGVLDDEMRQLQQELLAVEKQIALAGKNVEIDERIEELQIEQRQVAQKVANQEMMLDLLEQFIRYKMDAISATINSKFNGICFKLFENQINGGLKETCEVTYRGVPYGSLNNGHRIIAGLQIIKALQGLYDVKMPIFIDNAESVNDFNLPEMDSQMILLKVSEDKKLRIEVE